MQLINILVNSMKNVIIYLEKNFFKTNKYDIISNEKLKMLNK